MHDIPRVRFAPSPTGFLHVGGARTALFNWLFARHAGGVFVLRIEDTDRERSQAQLTDAILAGLDWLGLDWDEGPYHQADNLERHRADAYRLLGSSAAYRCFCTPAMLEEMRSEAKHRGVAAAYDGRCRTIDVEEAAARADAGESHTLRFLMPQGETVWEDVVAGETRFQNGDIEDFILLRSDGTPTYNLAVVSDDLSMNISHVIRGADHLSNTPKQIQIYRALGAATPVFCHVPLILGPDGKRLSKRHGATAVGEYRKHGILPQAMVNFLALLGWSPGDDQERLGLGDLVERFTLDRINKKPAIFDHDKLEWLNGQYIASLASTQLAALVGALLIESNITTPFELEERSSWFEGVLELLKGRARTLHEFARRARPFFPGAVNYDPQAVSKHWKDRASIVNRLAGLRSALEDLEPWAEDELERQVRAIAEDMGIGAGELIHPLRVALTGSAVSPGIFEVMHLMEKPLVLSRIDDALKHLGNE